MAEKKVDAVGAELLKLRKDSREATLWAKEGETYEVIIDEFEADPTERTNDFGKKYKTNDWLVPVKLDGGVIGKRKMHITLVDAIITQAEKEGKLQKGSTIMFAVPEREREASNRRGRRRY